MTQEIANTIEFDIRGQICPSTLLVTLKEVNRHFSDLNTGAIRLLIRTDNRNAINTIPTAVENMGLTATVDKTGSDYTILIGI